MAGVRGWLTLSAFQLEGKLLSLLHSAKVLQLDTAMGTLFRRPWPILLSTVCVLGP